MDTSFVTAPMLTKICLMSSDCKFFNHNLQNTPIYIEMKHGTEFKCFSDESGTGFLLSTTTYFVGKKDDDEESDKVIEINCKFISRFELPETGSDAEEYRPIIAVYANQVYPIVRRYLIEVLCHMGFNGTFLPQALQPSDFSETDEGKEES